MARPLITGDLAGIRGVGVIRKAGYGHEKGIVIDRCCIRYLRGAPVREMHVE